MVLECLNIMMINNIQDTLRMDSLKELENMNGQMEANIKENILQIKSVDTEHLKRMSMNG